MFDNNNLILRVQLNSIADGSAITAGASYKYSTDSGPLSAGSGNLAHQEGGTWLLEPSAGELTEAMNEGLISFVVTAAGAVPQVLNVPIYDSSFVQTLSNTFTTNLATTNSSVTAVSTLLNNATHGLAALKALIDILDGVADSINTKIDNGVELGDGALDEIADAVTEATQAKVAAQNAATTAANAVVEAMAASAQATNASNAANAILAIVSDVTNGNAAIKSQSSSNNSLLTDASHGLAALKTLIDGIDVGGVGAGYGNIAVGARSSQAPFPASYGTVAYGIPSSAEPYVVYSKLNGDGTIEKFDFDLNGWSSSADWDDLARPLSYVESENYHGDFHAPSLPFSGVENLRIDVYEGHDGRRNPGDPIMASVLASMDGNTVNVYQTFITNDSLKSTIENASSDVADGTYDPTKVVDSRRYTLSEPKDGVSTHEIMYIGAGDTALYAVNFESLLGEGQYLTGLSENPTLEVVEPTGGSPWAVTVTGVWDDDVKLRFPANTLVGQTQYITLKVKLPQDDSGRLVAKFLVKAVDR